MTALAATQSEREYDKFDSNNNVNENLNTLIAGEDQTNDVLKTEQRFSYTNITTATTTTIAGSKFLHTVTVNTTAAGSIIIKDNTTVIGTLALSVNPGTFIYDVSCPGGVVIVTAAASDVTVSWR